MIGRPWFGVSVVMGTALALASGCSAASPGSSPGDVSAPAPPLERTAASTAALEDPSPGAPASSLGVCAPLASVQAERVLPYVPVVPQRGACTSREIRGYVATCGSGQPAACAAWQRGHDACDACVQPANHPNLALNSGGSLNDADGQAWSNLPACVALRDGDDGCASALALRQQCEYHACNACRVAGEWGTIPSCLAEADRGACAAYAEAAQVACAADLAPGGSIASCGEGFQGNLGRILEVVCGGGG